MSDTPPRASNQPLMEIVGSPKRPHMSTEEFIAFEIPGPCRTLTPEEIAAEYGERATRPIPAGAQKHKRGVHHRIGRNKRMPFYVLKIFDSGVAQFISQHEKSEQADAEAGRLRDAMTDEECGGDFTYLAKERKRK